MGPDVRDIHNGRKQHASSEGPNTDERDNYLQITHIQLATHGRRANQQYRNAVVLMT
jgi:hypothetical protein